MNKPSFIKAALMAAAFIPSVAASAYETPTMGWSSWNTYRVNISADIICRQADAMASNGLKEAGYSYINIDDGFFGGRDESGQLLIHPQRFPEGLKPVADHIHSLGFKAGIYSDAGHNTCGNYWDKDAAGVGVGLYEHEEADARYYFDELGFDFIKIDFCGGDAKQNTENLQLDERERYTAIRKAIDAVGRQDVRINVCRWAFPGTWVHSIGSSWRIAGDIGPNWGALKRIINANRYHSAYAGEGHYNDMDMLEIGRGLSDAEERTHFGLWCIMSSPLLIGCDLTTIPQKSLDLITNPELIAINQDPLGLQAYIVQICNGATIYVKDIETANGTTRAVALFNPTDNAVDVTLDMADIDLSGNVNVRDLINRTDLDPVNNGTLTMNIGAHDTAILRLEAETRLERTVYEAETGWLERYQNIGKNNADGHATYADVATCSGGAKVGWLGHHPENYLEWRNVWSEKGGVYDLGIEYLQWEDRPIELTVNGGETQEMTLQAVEPKTNKIRSHNVKIVLAPGNNTIRIGHSTAWTPDLDRITLKLDKESSIAAPQTATAARKAVTKVLCNNGTLRLPGTGAFDVWSTDGRRHHAAAGTPTMAVAPGVYFLIPAE